MLYQIILVSKHFLLLFEQRVFFLNNERVKWGCYPMRSGHRSFHTSYRFLQELDRQLVSQGSCPCHKSHSNCRNCILCQKGKIVFIFRNDEANGEYWEMWIPLLLWNSSRSFCCSHGWSSIWWTAGTTSVSLSSLSISLREKFESPMALVFPLASVFSKAFHV